MDDFSATWKNKDLDEQLRGFHLIFQMGTPLF